MQIKCTANPGLGLTGVYRVQVSWVSAHCLSRQACSGDAWLGAEPCSAPACLLQTPPETTHAVFTPRRWQMINSSDCRDERTSTVIGQSRSKEGTATAP